MASRELKLLDLDDDALIMIIDKLDHKSKKQMMATCKRFEALIGETHQFYKNFKFRFDQGKFLESQDTPFLGNLRRHFETVEISGGTYYKVEELKPPILEFLINIGADILKIQFEKLSFGKEDFWKLMKALPKIRELEMRDLKFTTKSDPNYEDIGNFEFKHLTKLETGSTNLGFFATLVPATLKTLNFDCNWKNRFPAEVLGKQKQLEELSLIGCTIKQFKFDPENCHIKKLDIKNIEVVGSAFEKFSDFMKIQESVTELELWLSWNQSKKHAGIQTHLLGLKTLQKVTIYCEFLPIFQDNFGLKLCNPAVKSLTIQWPPRVYAGFKSLLKIFPNAANLKITRSDSRINLRPINSMKNIRKLEVELMEKEMLAQLKLEQLQELHVTGHPGYLRMRILNRNEFRTINLKWRTFIDNHSQLKVLTMPYCYISVEQLQITLENLPLLESLEVIVDDFNYGFVDDFSKLSDEELKTQYEKEQAERAAQLIGENYDRFEHLKIHLDDCNMNIGPIMLNYLEKHHPGITLIK